MDLADRYLNTKCVLYFLKANQIDKALKIASLFTKVFYFLFFIFLIIIIKRKEMIHKIIYMICNPLFLNKNVVWLIIDLVNLEKL